LRQRRLAQQLAEMNRHLERRVNERTAELETANRHLEAFSYSVSHDLSGPLQSIVGFSEVLTEQFGEVLGDKGRKHLGRVHAGALRMRELTEGFLALSGVVRTEIEREPVDMSALAEDVLREIREAEPNRSAEFVIQTGLRAMGDRVLLRAALVNLAGNAWKFTAKCQEARIEIGKTGDGPGEPAFFVKDNGAGFDMREAQKLFSAFGRLHKKEEFPGTGIGLATVQRIISKHGGRIWAQGRPNEGATFFFTLPSEPRTARNVSK
jgi:light-regulated signal transduction histidine kinase (bacteriophytochrome)